MCVCVSYTYFGDSPSGQGEACILVLHFAVHSEDLTLVQCILYFFVQLEPTQFTQEGVTQGGF